MTRQCGSTDCKPIHPYVMLHLDGQLGWTSNHLRDKPLGVSLKDDVIRLTGIGRPTPMWAVLFHELGPWAE